LTRRTLLTLVAGVVLVIVAVVLSLQLWPDRNPNDIIEWELTIVGSHGEQVILDFDDVKSLPTIETSGGYFTSVGVVYGPYTVKGVSIDALCNMVGGITASEILFVAAKDGYSAVFDYEQLNGKIDTYEPSTLRYVPEGHIRFLLIFAQDGQPLSHTDGRPLRLAVTNPDGLLTEGHWWVKWVDRIEIRAPQTTAPS
jgi:hypothetical protein